MAVAAFRAIVRGEVQGVGFRAYAARQARVLGICGWVRNTEDGGVEVWAQGEETPLEDFYDWLWQGPSAAWVRDVERFPATPRGDYRTFGIAF